MLTASHPAIGQCTRSLLRELVAQCDLEEASEDLLLRALAKTRPRSHAGWVFALAEALGADRPVALHAGVFAELCCAAVDLLDDVEDGDAGDYLCHAPVAVQINVSEHLLVLSVIAAARLEEAIGTRAVVAHAYRLFSAMASGQQLELTRENWSASQYELVARLTSSKQYELYLRASAAAARAEPGTLIELSTPLGIATQIACDLKSQDERLLALPWDQIQDMKRTWRTRTIDALEALAPPARRVLLEVSRFALETLQNQGSERDGGSRETNPADRG